MGVNYLLSDKYELALDKFAEAIRLSPSEPQYCNYEGLAYYMNGQYETCLKSYKYALKLYKDNNIFNAEVSECWYNLGNAYLHLSQEDEAIAAFKMAHEFEIKSDQRLKIYYSEGLAY